MLIFGLTDNVRKKQLLTVKSALVQSQTCHMTDSLGLLLVTSGVWTVFPNSNLSFTIYLVHEVGFDCACKRYINAILFL